MPLIGAVQATGLPVVLTIFAADSIGYLSVKLPDGTSVPLRSFLQAGEYLAYTRTSAKIVERLFSSDVSAAEPAELLFADRRFNQDISNGENDDCDDHSAEKSSLRELLHLCEKAEEFASRDT